MTYLILNYTRNVLVQSSNPNQTHYVITILEAVIKITLAFLNLTNKIRSVSIQNT